MTYATLLSEAGDKGGLEGGVKAHLGVRPVNKVLRSRV